MMIFNESKTIIGSNKISIKNLYGLLD